MNKTELEEAIKNGESVWEYRNYEIREINLKTMHPEMLNEYQLSYIVENNENATMYFTSIEDLYKTKAEAEHYLNHSNIYRTEQLPFLTWNEFRSGEGLIFVGKDTYKYILKLKDDEFKIVLEQHTLDSVETVFESEATEEQFYSDYDECMKIFKGE